MNGAQDTAVFPPIFQPCLFSEASITLRTRLDLAWIWEPMMYLHSLASAICSHASTPASRPWPVIFDIAHTATRFLLDNHAVVHPHRNRRACHCITLCGHSLRALVQGGSHNILALLLMPRGDSDGSCGARLATCILQRV